MPLLHYISEGLSLLSLIIYEVKGDLSQVLYHNFTYTIYFTATAIYLSWYFIDIQYVLNIYSII